MWHTWIYDYYKKDDNNVLLYIDKAIICEIGREKLINTNDLKDQEIIYSFISSWNETYERYKKKRDGLLYEHCFLLVSGLVYKATGENDVAGYWNNEPAIKISEGHRYDNTNLGIVTWCFNKINTIVTRWEKTLIDGNIYSNGNRRYVGRILFQAILSQSEASELCENFYRKWGNHQDIAELEDEDILDLFPEGRKVHFKHISEAYPKLLINRFTKAIEQNPNLAREEHEPNVVPSQKTYSIIIYNKISHQLSEGYVFSWKGNSKLGDEGLLEFKNNQLTISCRLEYTIWDNISKKTWYRLNEENLPHGFYVNDHHNIQLKISASVKRNTFVLECIGNNGVEIYFKKNAKSDIQIGSENCYILSNIPNLNHSNIRKIDNLMLDGNLLYAIQQSDTFKIDGIDIEFIDTEFNYEIKGVSDGIQGQKSYFKGYPVEVNSLSKTEGCFLLNDQNGEIDPTEIKGLEGLGIQSYVFKDLNIGEYKVRFKLGDKPITPANDEFKITTGGRSNLVPLLVGDDIKINEGSGNVYALRNEINPESIFIQNGMVGIELQDSLNDFFKTDERGNFQSKNDVFFIQMHTNLRVQENRVHTVFCGPIDIEVEYLNGDFQHEILNAKALRVFTYPFRANDRMIKANDRMKKVNDTTQERVFLYVYEYNSNQKTVHLISNMNTDPTTLLNNCIRKFNPF